MREANNQWKWTTGSGEISQTNVQSLLNTLATLHAVKWISASTPAHAFDKPQLIVTFTTSADDKARHKLVVGGPTPEGMAFAKTEEHEGVFVISRPDLNALKLPLAQTATPTPSASASATATPTP